ncbi:unnamed protein product [Linum trigynum]|uniref:Uncharacterized protein n=2 Tax=Linum trigynum TaxID=586398 RepID=A0AAV2D8B1_9ROSI
MKAMMKAIKDQYKSQIDNLIRHKENLAKESCDENVQPTEGEKFHCEDDEEENDKEMNASLNKTLNEIFKQTNIDQNEEENEEQTQKEDDSQPSTVDLAASTPKPKEKEQDDSAPGAVNRESIPKEGGPLGEVATEPPEQSVQEGLNQGTPQQEDTPKAVPEQTYAKETGKKGATKIADPMEVDKETTEEGNTGQAAQKTAETDSEKTVSDDVVREEAPKLTTEAAEKPKVTREDDIPSFDLSPLNRQTPTTPTKLTTNTATDQPGEPRKRRIVVKNVHGNEKKARATPPPAQPQSTQSQTESYAIWSNLYTNSQEKLKEVRECIDAYLEDLNSPTVEPVAPQSQKSPVEWSTPTQKTPDDMFNNILEYIRCKNKKFVKR